MTTIRIKRMAAGLTQVGLAMKTGLQPGLLCRYEQGIRPSQRNARRLATALECDVRALFPDYDRLRDY